jgi:hypothetical protein
MSRLPFRLVCCLLVAAVLPLCAAKPNIIFVVADDMAFRDTGYSGKCSVCSRSSRCGERA